MLAGEFHFLRPFWFLALLPAALLLLALWHSQLRASAWGQAISSRLLPHLLEARTGARRRWPLLLLFGAWLLATLSLAGPVWRKLPQPVRQRQDALVIIQDLSLSFYAQDLAPNRLTRARHKLLDILQARSEGLTGLIVYAGDAHLVCPLTDDTATIAAMVPDLDPGIMPSYGSNLPAAVEMALRLLKDAGISRGRLLLLTDEVEADQVAAVDRILRGQEVTLAVLGVGTAAGGPIPKGDGGFLQDGQGNMVIARLDPGPLRQLAADNGGRYREISLDDGDFRELLGSGTDLARAEEYRQVKRQFDQWQEEGYWLLLPILALALAAFRRGWLLFGLLLALLLSPRASQAWEWRDLWLNRDQQAARALAENDPARAAALFRTPAWKGAAEYRAGNYAGAEAAFAQGDSAEAYYNRGNALARQGRLAEAVKAYDQALKIAPTLADARANRQLVEELLKRPPPKQATENPQDKQGKQGQGQGQKGSGREQQDQAGAGQKAQPVGQATQPGQAGKAGQTNGQSPQAQTAAKNEAGQPGSVSPPETSPEGKQGKANARPEEKGEAGAERPVPEGKAGEQTRPGRQEPAAAAREAEKLTPEQQQALNQWLRLVPDNPGGLLRRKFEYQYENNRPRDSGGNRKIW